MNDELMKALRKQHERESLSIQALVGLVEQFFVDHGFRAETPGFHVRQILVLRLDELGDVALTSAFFRELRRNHPYSRITVVVKPECAELLRLSPYINRVEALETQALQRLGSLDVLTRLTDFSRRLLWINQYDLCIVPRFDQDRYLAGLLCLLSGARQRVGFAENATPWKQRMNKGYNAFYTTVAPGQGVMHEVERGLSLLKLLGGKIGSRKLEAWTGAADEAWAAEALSGVTMPIAAISPGGVGSNRCWPIERYAAVAAWLAQTKGMRLLVLGTAGEATTGRILEEQLADTVMDFTGKTTIGQMVCLLRRCQIYIGRDTGTLHLASAVGVPVVEISSCTAGASADIHFSSPHRFGPWGVPNRVLQPTEVEASCAGGCSAKEPHCILQISVREVQQAVGELLSSLPSKEAPSLAVPISEKSDTWSQLLRRFSAEQIELKKTDPSAALVAADVFFLKQLKRIRPQQAMSILPALTEHWTMNRRLPHRFGSVAPAEMDRLLAISSILRLQLRYLLLNHELSAFGAWSERQQQQWVSLWRLLFLSCFSPLALKGGKDPAQHEGSRLQDSLVRSLYDLTPGAEEKLDVASLLATEAPSFLKAIFCAWLMGTPYFGVVEQDRRRACRYAGDICKELTRPLKWLSFGAFATIMEEMMASFWRISYAGGDSSRELSALGDFITFHMNRLFPQEKLRIEPKSNAEPLKIGYISRNFCKQAVSFYMVNRVIHHDPSRFVLHTFVGGDRDDELTEVFKKHSDTFTRHIQLTDLSGIIRQIRESKLDILVFADLGMDPFTLMLAGLRLAPLQCVLVGHGVTSGMPNIDYYISGDFETEDAERFYREKLIRLPKLGAAQYPPIIPEKYPTRQDYKIPDDAVVYVSCANGIKIHPDQDSLFLEILRQVPKAWLVLKPFQTPDAVDTRFLERFFVPARAAGLADRILIVPPFKQAKDVLGLLAFADIQLDTYPYGGWTTNMEAVYMGLPIVTQEGDMARSRWGPSMLRALGVSEGIARDEAEYVEWAVKLGNDRELREKVRSVIKEKAVPAFFDGVTAQAAYEDVLVKCYRNKCEE